jgi:hypothetical protein
MMNPPKRSQKRRTRRDHPRVERVQALLKQISHHTKKVDQKAQEDRAAESNTQSRN